MSDQSFETPPPAKSDSKAFAGVATLLYLCIIICGVFAGFAGKKIGNQHLMFIISFVFLGLVVVLIFGLAFVDSNTRGPDQGNRHH